MIAKLSDAQVFEAEADNPKLKKERLKHPLLGAFGRSIY
jgi:hypothetical protein